MTTVYLLRHAESEPAGTVPEPDRPLSTQGAAQAERLTSRLAKLGTRAVYSSPYRRALDTVRPFARALSLDVKTDERLRECKLTDEWLDDFHSALRRTWSDFDFAFPGGESCASCQRRVVAAVAELAGRHRGQTLLVSSHGNAIGLCLNHIDASFGFEQWTQMKTPDLFQVELESGSASWRHVPVTEEREST